MLTFDRLRNFSLFAAFAAAPIPLFIYITAEHANWLWLMIGVNIFAYIMVALTTIRITLDVAQREKQKRFVPAKWADNPVMSKWYTAVRLSRKWHLLAAVARMGLVLGVVQLFHTSTRCWGVQSIFLYSSEVDYYSGSLSFSASMGILSPFCYVTPWYYVIPGTVPSFFQYFPQREPTMIAFLLLSLLSLAENRLLIAITLTLYKRAESVTSIISSLAMRFITVVSVATILSVLLPVYSPFQNNSSRTTLKWLFCTQEYSSEDCFQQMPDVVIERYFFRAMETGYTSGFSILDNGVVSVSHLLMDTGGGDNRPFMARNIVAGLLGLLLYAGLTRGFLWLAKRQEEKAPSLRSGEGVGGGVN